MKQYMAVVIGAGPAGHTCAVRMAAMGAKVAVVERDYIGGICTNWGCTPSKAMIEAAKIARIVRESSKYGIRIQDLQIDFKAVAKRRDQVIEQSRQNITRLLEYHNVDIYLGEADVVEMGRVSVRKGKLDLDGDQMHYTGEKEEIQAEHIILATGSQPLIPEFIGRDNPFVVSSNRLISIGTLPERLTIIGGGVIGLEFATIFSNLGSQVTIIEYLDRILAGMDPEISEELCREMTANGVEILTSHKVTSVEAGLVLAEDRREGRMVEVPSEAILVAIGRKPVIEKEMFNRLGIDYTDKGICVDEFMRTNVPGVWAIGDATGKSILAHVGIQQGIVCAENIMKAAYEPSRRMDYDVIPAVVYSIPELVSVGYIPEGVMAVEVYKIPFSVNMRARVEGFDEGFIKIWVKDHQILASQAIGHNVSEIMQEIANMIALKTPIHQVAEIIHAHPTYAEITRSILEYAMDKQVDFICEGPEFACSAYRPEEMALEYR